MSELSPMEQDVYGYIESMIENEGYAPSVRDIAVRWGFVPPPPRTPVSAASTKRGISKRIRANPARCASAAPNIPTGSGCSACRCSAA